MPSSPGLSTPKANLIGTKQNKSDDNKATSFPLIWTIVLASLAAFLISPFVQLLFAPLDTTSTTIAITNKMSSSAARAVSRSVAKKVRAIETGEGAGATVRRSIGTPALRNISPFLMLDHFRIPEGAGFPDHPHRGQTTVTYLLEGTSKHEDFAGHAGTIGPGDVQWMNAGHGIMHAEMPIHRDADGNKLVDPVGLQLWVDLPKEAKRNHRAIKSTVRHRYPQLKPKVLRSRSLPDNHTALLRRFTYPKMEACCSSISTSNPTLAFTKRSILATTHSSIRSKGTSSSVTTPLSPPTMPTKAARIQS